MNEKVFFDFSDKFRSGAIQAGPINLECITNQNRARDLIKGDYADINFPIIFKQDYGKKLLDMLGTGHANLFLISDRFKKALEDNHLTGWKTYLIKLYDKKENEIFGYHGFSIVGTSGRLDYRQSEIIEKRLVPTGPICKYYKGVQVNMDSWDGSDFFTPGETYEIVISEKAANILKKEKITNIYLEDLRDIENNVRNIPHTH
jgi:hypothetical protein